MWNLLFSHHGRRLPCGHTYCKNCLDAWVELVEVSEDVIGEEDVIERLIWVDRARTQAETRLSKKVTKACPYCRAEPKRIVAAVIIPLLFTG